MKAVYIFSLFINSKPRAANFLIVIGVLVITGFLLISFLAVIFFVVIFSRSLLIGSFLIIINNNTYLENIRGSILIINIIIKRFG